MICSALSQSLARVWHETKSESFRRGVDLIAPHTILKRKVREPTYAFDIPQIEADIEVLDAYTRNLIEIEREVGKLSLAELARRYVAKNCVNEQHRAECRAYFLRMAGALRFKESNASGDINFALRDDDHAAVDRRDRI